MNVKKKYSSMQCKMLICCWIQHELEWVVLSLTKSNLFSQNNYKFSQEKTNFMSSHKILSWLKWLFRIKHEVSNFNSSYLFKGHTSSFTQPLKQLFDPFSWWGWVNIKFTPNFLTSRHNKIFLSTPINSLKTLHWNISFDVFFCPKLSLTHTHTQINTHVSENEKDLSQVRCHRHLGVGKFTWINTCQGWVSIMAQQANR